MQYIEYSARNAALKYEKSSHNPNISDNVNTLWILKGVKTMQSTARVKTKGYIKAAVFAGNVLIILAMIMMCINYVRMQKVQNRTQAMNAFSPTVASMHKALRNYMISQQRSCNDWAVYINSRNMTLAEAIDYLNDSVSVEGKMGHIVDYDTLMGFSSESDKDGNSYVDYSHQENHVEMTFDGIETDGIDDTVYITKTYINPINELESVGFCQDICLREESGAKKHWMLVRVIPLSMIEERSEFPAGYEDGELSIISESGEYVVRTKSFYGDNFWEFLKENNPDRPRIDRIKNDFINDDIQVAELSNGEGKTSYYVCLQAKVNSKIYYVGYIPADSIVDTYVDFTMVGIVLAGFMLMLLVNGAYIFYVNTKLRESIEQTRMANEAKTRFLSSMSHDIRTPMNAIVGFTSIASSHMNDPEQVQDCLQKISLASNHMLTLVNDILDISKVESGKITLNPMVFSLSEVMTNIVNIVRPQVREKNLDLKVHLHEIEYEYLFADELRINQIFMNILSNAVKYTNEGEIVVSLEEKLSETDEASVDLTYTVQDTGIGMSKALVENMYQSFVRAIDTRVDKIQGTGLGLAITKQMVDLMDGTIDCESEPGVGTKFTVNLTLPVADRPADDFVLPPMHMLLVDDDEVFIETARATFESMGVTVDVAYSGRRAVEMVAKKHAAGKDYPVIIVDWCMHGMNGVETTKAIREEVGDDVPIIIASTYDWAEVEEEASEIGISSFINKPFFKSTVYAKMNEILRFDEEEVPAVSDDDFSDLEGMNLLVAEDNDLNWEILQEILSENGIDSIRAENGQICVDMLTRAKHGTYDAVIMDIQMPVMNGYEATREIRRMNSADKCSIPIIAMTADAFAEDVQACVNAGMDGHVAKPIDVRKLLVTLREVGLGRRNTIKKG